MNRSRKPAKSLTVLSGVAALLVGSAVAAPTATQAFSQPDSDDIVGAISATKKQQKASLTPKQVKSVFGQKQRVNTYDQHVERRTKFTLAGYEIPTEQAPFVLAATGYGKGKNGPKLNLSETVEKEDKIVTYQFDKRSKSGRVLVKRSVRTDEGDKLLLMTMTRVDRKKAVIAFVVAAKFARKDATKAINEATRLLAKQNKMRT